MFGPRGGAARQDVVVAADTDLRSASGKDEEARAAKRKAKKQSEMKRQGEKASRMGKEKAQRDGQKLYGFNRQTAVRNRRH